MTHQRDGMIDLDAAESVEMEIDDTGKLWVNVDGICRLRIGKVATVKAPRTRKIRIADDER